MCALPLHFVAELDETLRQTLLPNEISLGEDSFLSHYITKILTLAFLQSIAWGSCARLFMMRGLVLAAKSSLVCSGCRSC